MEVITYIHTHTHNGGYNIYIYTHTMEYYSTIKNPKKSCHL